jgi:hypothetical protein
LYEDNDSINDNDYICYNDHNIVKECYDTSRNEDYKDNNSRDDTGGNDGADDGGVYIIII